MKTAVIVTLVLLLSGCATYYRVGVNGYLGDPGVTKQLKSGVSIFVQENKSAKNPILESEIRLKIEKLLTQKGYRLQEQDKAEYYLRYSYAISCGRGVYESREIYRPGDTATVYWTDPEGRTTTSYATVPGYYSYVPYQITIYTTRLTLEVFDARLVSGVRQARPVWIGEVYSSSDNDDLREMIDYLLVGAFRHFGENTGRNLVSSISKKEVKERLGNGTPDAISTQR